MEILETKRLDHLGVVMGMMRELGIIELIDQKLGQHDQSHVSPGAAVAAMVLNGLGFVSRPLSLTPHFFATKPTDVLLDQEVNPEDLNRHKLGRVLDSIHAYGCEVLFSEIAFYVCEKIGLHHRFTSLDTTSFSVSGAYDDQTDEHEITLTHGYSKDHRPDLKQVVLELVTSHDGGIPLMMKVFDGNASDTKIFKERCEAFVAALTKGSFPQVVVGDSKLYHEDNKNHLQHLQFITRIPGTYGAEQEAILEAMACNQWTQLDEKNAYYEKSVTHLGMQQRWLIVKSQSAQERALKTLTKKIDKEYALAQKALMQLHKKEFACAEDAKKHLKDLAQTFIYHELILDHMICNEFYEIQGRPKKGAKPTKKIYHVVGTLTCLPEQRNRDLVQRSCYVIGTNVAHEDLSAEAVIEAYKNQNATIERGFRFLKDPQFFVSSLFLKKTSRIMGLLMIMTLSLLIYAVCQRHLRNQLMERDETLPNQIKKPVKNPTMRWIFQLLEGVDVVYVNINGDIHKKITGITPLKEKILRFFSPHITHCYQLNPIIHQ